MPRDKTPRDDTPRDHTPRPSAPRKDKNRVPRAKRALPQAVNKDAERVAKVIARAGLGSRREVEEWIAEGRVAVNGTVLDSPALTVTAEDVVTVDGAPLPERERTRLFLYHKPKGVVTTNKDPEGRTTLFEILPRGLPRLVSVGRLDLNSEGLLLLTNDGGLARVLELPETGWLRRYRVRANGAVDQAQLDTLMRGITVDGVEYGPVEAVLDRVQGANVWITVALREGKNREVRNVLGALGLKVGRLIRTSYGPFQLGELAEGAVEEVRTRILRDQIGQEIAAAAGADFTGPLLERALEETPPRPSARRRGEDAPDDMAEPRPKRARAEKTRAAVAHPARGRADDFSGPEPGAETGPRGRRRRLGDTHELETRGTVADRKGRTVKVERVVAPAGQASSKPASRAGRDRWAEPADERPRGRPGRPGARQSERGGYGAPGGRPERPFRDGAPTRRPARGDERPYRSEDREERPPRRPRAERPFRADDDRPFTARGPQGPGRSEGRPPRAGAPTHGRRFRDEADQGRATDDRPPRRPRAERPFRAEDDRPFTPRGPKGPGRSEGRPPRTEGAPRGRRFREDGDFGRAEGPARRGFAGGDDRPAPRGGARTYDKRTDDRRGEGGRAGKPSGPGARKGPARASAGGAFAGPSRAGGRGGPKGPGKGGPKGPPKGRGGRPGPKR